MSTDDTDSDEVEIYTTRRRFTQTVGAVAVPATHAGNLSWWERLIGRGEDHAGVGEDLVIQQNGEVVERDINTLNFEGTSIKEITQPNDHDDNVIRITLQGGGGDGAGAFVDTDDDGVAELQDEHADLQGGDVRNAGSVDADDGQIGATANVGAGDRPLITNGDVTVTVDAGGGADYTSLQDALDDVPIYVRHRYRINVNDGAYSEDAVMHPSIVGDFNSGSEYERGDIQIIGNTTTPSNVQIDSLSLAGVVGTGNSPILRGFQLTSTNPYDNEDASLAMYGCNHVGVGSDIEFAATATAAIVVYSSCAQITNVDITPGSYDNGVNFKTNAKGFVKNFTGTGSKQTFRTSQSWLMFDGSTTPSGASEVTVAGSTGGFAVDVDSDTWYGLTKPAGSFGTNLQTPSDESASRSFDTEYQNNTDSSRMVSVILRSSDGSDEFFANIAVGNASGGEVKVDETHLQSGDISGDTRVTLGPVEVPPGGYYIVNTGTNTASIHSWNEWNRAT